MPSRSPRRKPSKQANDHGHEPYAPPDDLRLPDANALFIPIRVAPSDIDSLSRNSVFRRLVQDIHARQYTLRADAVRAADMVGLAEVRGRVQELDRLLSLLHSYLTGEFDMDNNGDDTEGKDGDGGGEDDEMTVSFDA